MLGQVVKSTGSSFSTSSTSCFVAAAQRRVLSSKMVTGLGFGSLREMTSGCCWSLSLCNGPRELQMRRRSLGLSREFREKSCTWGVRMFSHTEEPGEGNVIIVEDSETINRFLQEAGDSLVVLDISSKTCGPCRRIYPMVVQLSIEYPGVIFLKINGDRSINTSRALMKKWGVGAVPTFRFFQNGELVHSQTGAKLDVLKTHLAQHYNKTIRTQQM
ncbi:hypothetical protein BDL97_02G181800 [Sphagnum fallax]|nr:hypothetical protein BDL97_02G181800 [Sphagnum fallax]